MIPVQRQHIIAAHPAILAPAFQICWHKGEQPLNQLVSLPYQ